MVALLCRVGLLEKKVGYGVEYCSVIQIPRRKKTCIVYCPFSNNLHSFYELNNT